MISINFSWFLWFHDFPWFRWFLSFLLISVIVLEFCDSFWFLIFEIHCDFSDFLWFPVILGNVHKISRSDLPPRFGYCPSDISCLKNGFLLHCNCPQALLIQFENYPHQPEILFLMKKQIIEWKATKLSKKFQSSPITLAQTLLPFLIYVLIKIYIIPLYWTTNVSWLAATNYFRTIFKMNSSK